MIVIATENKTKVYIETDKNQNIIKIFSDAFEQPSEESLLIDEGQGDKYAHAQGQYFSKPLFGSNGIANYKYIGGEIIVKTQEEIQAEISALPKPTQQPSINELEATIYYIGMMTGVL